LPRQPIVSMQAGKVLAAAASWRMPPSIQVDRVLAADSRTIHRNGTRDDLVWPPETTGGAPG